MYITVTIKYKYFKENYWREDALTVPANDTDKSIIQMFECFYPFFDRIEKIMVVR